MEILGRNWILADFVSLAALGLSAYNTWQNRSKIKREASTHESGQKDRKMRELESIFRDGYITHLADKQTRLERLDSAAKAGLSEGILLGIMTDAWTKAGKSSKAAYCMAYEDWNSKSEGTHQLIE